MMDSIKLCRLLLVLLLCYVTWIHCVNITATTPCKLTAAIKTKLTKVNTSVTAALKPAFLTQLVTGAASLDTSIAAVMKSVYNVPLTGLLCLYQNYKTILAEVQAKSFTLANIESAATSSCSLFSSYITAIKTAADDVVDDFGSGTPALLEPLPPKIVTLVNDIVQYVGNWSAATAPSTALYTQYVNLIKNFKGQAKADFKKVENKISWATKFLTGADKKPLVNLLVALESSVQKLAIENAAKITPLANKLLKALTGQLVEIAQWAITNVNGITITPTVKADSTIQNMANTVQTYVGNYGSMVYSQFYPYVVNAVGGCYKVVF